MAKGGKIKNWDRRQSLESSKRPYVWVNTVSEERARRGGGKKTTVSVRRLSNGWKVKIDRPTNPKSKVVDTKENARKKAVSWMRKNTSG
jgi:hypothetical protein